MRQPGQPTDLHLRLQIAELAAHNFTDPQIAQSLDVSVWTVRKWRRRNDHQGRIGLTSSMGRPTSGGRCSTFPASLKNALVELRQLHPGWGPLTLLAELARLSQWQTQPLPSRTSVAKFLKQAQLTRPYQTHIEMPQAVWHELKEPHQLWELDAQGATQVAGIGKVGIINIVDTLTHLKIESYPSLRAQQPNFNDYQLALRRAFIQFGLPGVLSLDHGPVFYDNSQPSPFPTRFHLWVISLGIEVRFIRKGRPTDHGQVERSHQTLQHQALDGQEYSGQMDLWAGLDERRFALNNYLPSQAWGGLAPLEVYPEAIHSARDYRPQWETELISLERVNDYLSQGRWFRRVRPTGTIWIGGNEYYIGKSFEKKEVELSYEASNQKLVAKPEGSNEIIKVPIQGLNKANLMGELGELRLLPFYQLAWPLTAPNQRQMEYAAMLTNPARLL